MKIYETSSVSAVLLSFGLLCGFWQTWKQVKYWYLGSEMDTKSKYEYFKIYFLYKKCFYNASVVTCVCTQGLAQAFLLFKFD